MEEITNTETTMETENFPGGEIRESNPASPETSTGLPETDDQIKLYLNVDPATGKISAVHETYQNLDEHYFVRFDPPENWDPMSFTHYKYVDGQLVWISPQERIDLYYGGVDPEEERRKAEQLEEQMKTFEQMFKRSFLNALSDEEALQVPLMFGSWKTGVNYKEGDRVCHGGLLMKCLADHKSGLTNSPDINSSKWEATRADVIGTQYPDWENGVVYSNGDMVLQNGFVWQSSISNNTFEPGMSTTWTKIG